jgi:hypothetical protein
MKLFLSFYYIQGKYGIPFPLNMNSGQTPERMRQTPDGRKINGKRKKFV